MPDNDQVKILTFGRCTYLTKTGRQCRSQIIYPDGRYCRRHILTQATKDDFELLLTDQALRFRNTRGIHNSLQRLYGLLAAGEISPRRAATLATSVTCSSAIFPIPSRPIPGIAAATATPMPRTYPTNPRTKSPPRPPGPPRAAPPKNPAKNLPLKNPPR